MYDDEFDRAFMALSKRAPISTVQTVLGLPEEKNELTVPAGSGWGKQTALSIEIVAGDTYLEWVYHRNQLNYIIWFARHEDDWAVSFRGSVDKATREQFLS